MARPPRPPGGRGDGRDRASSRRPGEASGPIRRAPQRGRARGESSSDAARRQPPQRRTPRRERDRPMPPSARSGRVGSTAHPEAHRLTTRTDLSQTVLGPRNYTPRRIGLLAVIAIILLVTVSFPLRNHYQYLRDEKAVMQERAVIEQTIAELEAEQKLLEDPAFIEQQARIRFGAVKPGETPYRVAMEDPVEKAEAERRAAELEAQSWQTRVWDSIAEPRDPVVPEASTLPDPTTPGEQNDAPDDDAPEDAIPEGAIPPDSAPQEDPPA
ncbi:MAG TPA: septum formation initiator family protein [Candidatus Dietzia intestinipullorum]|nr:septum formation initiator family protein [Candidatus Dietzia intestinipullorum]